MSNESPNLQPECSCGAKVLIFVVAYNAERTLKSVLDRVPQELWNDHTEVLVIDDQSSDDTFLQGLGYRKVHPALKITVLRNPLNQGYGGNQKLGYNYAIRHGFDIVALVHGDGQYAPERLPDLLVPLQRGQADAVFGSRMINRKDALKGGMPLYKWVGNQILTAVQNRLLGSQLSEFHSGYRLYSTKALQQIPFERNTNDFHFDTEIIIQFLFKGLRIKELPIPTYYGDEICHVNGLRYAWDVMKAVIRARLQKMDLFYDRKFDVESPSSTYDLKLGFDSSHTRAILAVPSGSKVLDIGCAQGLVADKLAERGCRVVGFDACVPVRTGSSHVSLHALDLDNNFLPVHTAHFERVLMLDVIEHLKMPEKFIDHLRATAGLNPPTLIITTANIGFIVTRLMLLFGQFNYGKRGILDLTHTRLFTFGSLRMLLSQSGYHIVKMQGIPAPFPKALGSNWFGSILLRINQGLIYLVPGLFSYQIYVEAKALPTVDHLLNHTIDSSELASREKEDLSELISKS